MHKYDCKKCIFLTLEGKSKEWVCYCNGVETDKIEECPEGKEKIKEGDKIYWNDPENICSGFYIVLNIVSDTLISIKLNENLVKTVNYNEIL